MSPWRKIEHHRDDDGVDEDPARTAWDLRVARAIIRCLEDHYPGHPWMADVQSAQGVAMIWVHAPFMGMWKFFIKLSDLWSDPMMRCVMRAGGEICERYGLRREAFCRTSYLDGVQKMRALGANAQRKGVLEL